MLYIKFYSTALYVSIWECWRNANDADSVIPYYSQSSQAKSVSDMISLEQNRTKHHPYGEQCITMNVTTASVLFPVRKFHYKNNDKTVIIRAHLF